MIAATLSGPTYAFRPNNDESAIEVFESVGDVLLAMLDRHHAKGQVPQLVRLLNGESMTMLVPAWGVGTTLTCYEVEDEFDQFGITETQVLEVLSLVHTESWDFRLSLVRDANEEVCVKIENRQVI